MYFQWFSWVTGICDKIDDYFGILSLGNQNDSKIFLIRSQTSMEIDQAISETPVRKWYWKPKPTLSH